MARPSRAVYHARVRSHMTDLNRVMWHGAYLNVFDDARIETFRRIDYTYADVLKEGWALAIRRVEIDYLSPAFMDDEIEIEVRVVDVSRARLVLGYHCSRRGDLLARGAITYVFLDEAGRPLRAPERLRRVIAEHAAYLQFVTPQ